MKRHTMRSVFILAVSLGLAGNALAQKEPPKAKVLGSGASTTLSNANAVAIPSTGGPQPTGPAENYGVYKHIDGQGRVTYTNFPVQGGQKIELDPITVLPVVPPAARPVRTASAPAIAPPAPVAKVAATSPAQAAPAVTPSAVAIVTPVPSPARAVAPAPPATFASDTPTAPLRPSTVLTLPTAPAPKASPGVAPTSRSLPVAVASPAPAVTLVAAAKPLEDGERRKNLEAELAGEEKSRLSVQALLEAERQQGESLKKTLAEMAEARISSAEAQSSVARNQQRTRSLQLSLDEHTRNIEALRRELGGKP